MRSRSTELEMLDAPVVPAVGLRAALNFMAFVNRFLGGASAVTAFFDRQEVPSEFTVLDLGCGGGDIASAIGYWARRRGKTANITAIDLNPDCLDYARRRFSSSGVRFLRRSAFDIEALGRFDYIISSMFFHHLDDGQILSLLALMEKQSRRGFLVNDLFRGHLNYWGAFFLALPTLNPMVIHDAKLSVRRAFKERDFAVYRRQSGIPFSIERRPVFRILMSRHAKRND